MQPSLRTRSLTLLALSTRCSTLALWQHAPAARPYATLREILDALGAKQPYTDSAGKPIGARLLNKRFARGLPEMSATSGGRRELLAVASTAVHAVLALLAPEPLATAAALAVPRQRNVDADPLRAALVTAAQPRGRRLLELVAGSPMAQSLLESYMAASARKESAAVKAQILAPFTCQYSLRIFNEIVKVRLGAPVTRHQWAVARWHEGVWRAGQTPPESRTPKWRLAGHRATLEAIDFLTNGENLQQVAYDTRRVKKDDGDYITLPKVEHVTNPHPHPHPHPHPNPSPSPSPNPNHNPNPNPNPTSNPTPTPTPAQG